MVDKSVVSLCMDIEEDEKVLSSGGFRGQPRNASHGEHVKYWNSEVSSCRFRFFMNSTISSTTKKMETSVVIP